MDNLTNGAKGGTFCLGNTGVIIVGGSGNADAETLADIPFCIDGIMYTLTSAGADIKLDGNTVTTLTTALFTVCVSTGGTITVVKSAEVTNADMTAGKTIDWPAATAGTCPIAGLKIKNATAAVFTGGTTLLDASDITTTFFNFFSLPPAPVAE